MRSVFAVAEIVFAALMVQVAAQVAPPPKLLIGGVQPFTGGWPAGESMSMGGQKMVEYVNANPSLLPGYELEVIWQDGNCDPGPGKKLIYKNWYDGRYFPYNAQERTNEKTVAMLGPGCSGTASAIAMHAYYMRIPMVSNSATRPSLSDREAFPGFWRTLTPDTAFNEAWLAIAKGLGFDEVTAVTGARGDNWDSMAKPLVQASHKLGMQIVGPSMSHMNLGTGLDMHGWELPEPSLDLAEKIIDELQKLKPKPPRFAVLMMFAPEARTLFCAAHRKGLKGIQFMFIGWFADFWWRSGLDNLPCTAEDLEEAVNGSITANADQRRPDTNTPLTCADGVTAGNWFDWYEVATASLPSRKEGAATADAVCTLALMLHELIYTHGATVPDLEHMSDSLYNTSQNILEATDFEGTQGRFKFVPGLPDPRQAIILEQVQCGDYNRSQDKLIVARYVADEFKWTGIPLWLPEGKVATATSPVTTVSSATFDYGSSVPLSEFATCAAGTVLNMAENLCEPCPENMEYVPSIDSCLCIQGFYSVPLQDTSSGRTHTCQPCGPGEEQHMPGQSECTKCKPGHFKEQEGSNLCQECPIGKYQALEGQKSCTLCEEGHVTAEVGSERCLQCRPGTKQDLRGQAECQLCDIGFYNEHVGSSSCEQCPNAMSTVGQATPNIAQCSCASGTYFDLDTGNCKSCPSVGVTCPGGRTYIQNGSDPTVMITEGYMTVPSEPLVVYICSGDSRCPGSRSPFPEEGRAPMCEGGYMGAACGGCKGGLTKESLAACQECPLTATQPIIMLIIGFICATGLGAWVFHVSRLPPNALSITFSILLNHCQTLSIVGTFSIPFPLTLVVVFDFLQIFMIDLSALNIPTDCAFGSTFLQRFATELALPLMLMSGFLGTYFAGMAYKALRVRFAGAQSKFDLVPQFAKDRLSEKYLNMHLRHWWAMDRREILSAAIVLHNGFFIAFTSMCMKPLVWTLHPSKRYTLVSYPDVLTIDPDWKVSLFMAIPCLFLYCVVYISIVIYAVLLAPKLVPINPKFRILFEELWDDSDPSCWWFCLVNLLYALMLNMIPFVTTTARLQLIWSSILFAAMLMMFMVYRPMRYALNNMTQLVLMSSTFFFITCSQVTFDEDGRSDTMSYILMLILLLPMLGVIAETAKFAYNKKLYLVKVFAEKAKFAYRMDDTLHLVMDKSASEIHSTVCKMEDSDLQKLELALDCLQYNFLRLQPKSIFRKRCHNLGPHGEVWPQFGISSKAMLERMAFAKGLTRQDDPRALARSFKEMIKEENKKKSDEEGLKRQGSKLSTTSILRAVGVSNFTFDLADMLGITGRIGEDDFILKVQQLSTCHFSREQLSQLFKFIDIQGLGKVSLVEIEAALQFEIDTLTEEGGDCSQEVDPDNAGQTAAGEGKGVISESANIQTEGKEADILISVIPEVDADDVDNMKSDNMQAWSDPFTPKSVGSVTI